MFLLHVALHDAPGSDDRREHGATTTIMSSFQVGLLVILWTIGTSAAFSQSSAPSTKPAGRTVSVNAPDWYNHPPSVRDTLIARGKGRSHDEQVAVDKAVAEARSALARSIDHRWKELLRAIAKEAGTHREWTPEPVTLESSVPLFQKAVKRGNTWTAYVIVAMPEGSARTVLHARLHRDAAWYDTVRNTRAVRMFETPTP